MTNLTLAQSYLQKCLVRLEALELFFDRGDYSDVVREAQEVVELALKAILRSVGIEPPRWHDVSPVLRENRGLLPLEVRSQLRKLSTISRRLRKDRELAFYGDEDFIPSREYSRRDAKRALEEARFVVQIAQEVIPLP